MSAPLKENEPNGEKTSEKWTGIERSRRKITAKRRKRKTRQRKRKSSRFLLTSALVTRAVDTVLNEKEIKKKDTKHDSKFKNRGTNLFLASFSAIYELKWRHATSRLVQRNSYIEWRTSNGGVRIAFGSIGQASWVNSNSQRFLHTPRKELGNRDDTSSFFLHRAHVRFRRYFGGIS